MIVHNTTQLKTKRNQQIIAFEGDSITNEIIANGEYDGYTLAFMSDILSKIQPKLSLDIGANIGNHSLVIATHSQRLIAFEPIPFLHEVLSKNLILNGLSQAHAFNVGLSDTTKNAQIYVDQAGNFGASSISERNGNGKLLAIQLVKGDDFLNKMGVTGIDFIKIDVEGHEAEAIAGLAESIQRDNPLILMEWKSEHTRQQFAQSALFSTVLANYTAYSLTTNFNKKVHAPHFFAQVKRVRYKYFKPAWCLSSFKAEQRYSNVCLVPVKHRALFAKLPYLAHHTLF